MKLIICLMLTCCFHWASAASVNDFSMLLPLPEPAKFSTLLSPSDAGALGPLLPLEVYKHLPPLVVESKNEETYQKTLRVVAVRLDPCFVEGPPVEVCRRQVRLVWQPITKVGSALSARDAAVHTFHEFQESTWNSLLEEWKKLASGQPTDPLQIHPVMKAQTLKGPFWQHLRTTLLRYCGSSNLVRVTAMNVFGNERIWEFSGFDIVSGAARPITIARINGPSQLVGVNIDLPKEFVGAVKPQPAEDLNFFKLIRNSQTTKVSLNEQEMKAVMSTAFAYENPKLHNTASLDCVSCHMSEGVRRWGQQNFPTWAWSAEFKTRYANPWFRADPVISPFKPNQLRAFGYFLKEPVISERTVNETLEVTRTFLNSASPRKIR